MNTHIPQSIETAYELKALTAVPTQIISPATSDPIIQVKEDTLTAAYLITLPHIRLDKKEVFNLLMTNNTFTGELPKAGDDGKWRGQDMFSMFLPDISFKKNNNSYDIDPVPENTVIVENGEFKQGVLDKGIFGKTIIKMIYDSYGNKAVQDFLDNNQRMLTRWLAGHGFTIGMGDCIPTQDNIDKINELIVSKVKDVNSVVKEANMGTYKQNLDNKFIKLSLEADIQDYLNMAKMDFEKYIRKNIEHQNAIFTTVSAGSKGSFGNITQIRGMVGQNTVAGKRVTFGYERRTLPLFSKDDYGARSRGFVANCFFNGLDPIDYFFHQMGGREGVIDTAIKTAESGYMQRRLIKALEDLTVKYGGTVRNGINNIVQFAYGDDGIDPCKLNKQELKVVELSDEQMAKKYLITEDDHKLMKTILTAGAYKELVDFKEAQKIYDDLINIRNKARQFYFRDMTVMNCTVYSPVLFTRTINNAKDMFKMTLTKKSDLTPQFIFENFRKLEAELLKYLPEFSINIFRALLFSTLSPKVCIIEYRFNSTVFKFIIDTIREKYLSSLVQPGEMVGVVGAQSMGEPLTQMSVPADTKIIIQHNGEVKRMDIGEFIDGQLNSSRGKLTKDKTGKHMIMEIDDEAHILSVSHDEKNAWKKISKISRHPVNGKLMKVTTRSGRNARATLSHSFLKRTSEGIVPIEGANLKVGDRIPITLNLPFVEDKMRYVEIGDIKMELTTQFGYFCGQIVMTGDMMKMGVKLHKKMSNTFMDSYVERMADKYGWNCTVNDNVITVKSARLGYWFKENFTEKLPAFMFQASGDYVKGFLAAVMDTSATIDTNKMNIRFVSTQMQVIQDISLLMAHINVFAVLSEEQRTYGNVMLMSISRKYAETLHNNLEMLNMTKKEQLVEIVNYLKRDDVHDVSEYIDKIPACGNLISDVGRLLGMPQHSRYYGRWRNKESIGRRTLGKYLEQFRLRKETENIHGTEVDMKMALLEQAYGSDVIWDEIIRIEQYNGEDDEYVYDFTVPGSESFMVENGVLVHNTLNSVEWNTEVIIDEDGEMKKVKIGEWIDERMENADAVNIEHHPHDTLLEYVKDKKIFVPACTEDGKIIWDEVEAVTRHPVVNKDGSKTLVKVTTDGGRTVIATKAKSFLKRVNNKIIGVDGDSIKVGDYLPIDAKDMIKDDYPIIPDVILSTGTVDIDRNNVIEGATNEDRQIIWNILNEEEIYYDRISKIEEIESEYPWVYDLTVKQTRNFNIANGLCMRDTFHNAGVGASGVVTTTGVPRIKEIINVAKTIKVPAMEIHLKPQFQDDVNKAKTIANQIEFTKLQDLVEKTMIVYENPNVPTQYQEDLQFAQIYQQFSEIIGVSQCPREELSHWVLRVVFSKEKMMNKNIFLSDIQEVIQRNSVEDDIQCVFTDDNAKEMMMRIIVREDSYDGDYLAFLQELEKELMGITIRGLPNVEKAVPQMMKRLEYREDGSYNQSTEWFLATIGVNLLDVLINENVDAKRTMSNDIHEINEIFGIEATRNIILHELMKLDDYPVNYRHISLLGDIMTHRGVIMTIERHGINRSTERGAIAKATFEESTEILVKASTFGEKDRMGGVSANIMFGQLPKVGTNAFDLRFDESKFVTELQNHKYEVVERVDAKDLAEQLEQQIGEYGENAGELIEDAFDFSYDKSKNPEKSLPPHAFPDASILKKKTTKKTDVKPEPVKETPTKKRTIVMKKKVTKTV